MSSPQRPPFTAERRVDSVTANVDPPNSSKQEQFRVLVASYKRGKLSNLKGRGEETPTKKTLPFELTDFLESKLCHNTGVSELAVLQKSSCSSEVLVLLF